MTPVHSLSEAWVSVWQPGGKSILVKSDIITQIFVALKSGRLLLGEPWWKKTSRHQIPLFSCANWQHFQLTWERKKCGMVKSRGLETLNSRLNSTLPLCKLGHNIFSEHLFSHLENGATWENILRIRMCKEPNLLSGYIRSSTSVRSLLSYVDMPHCSSFPSSDVPAEQRSSSQCLVWEPSRCSVTLDD